MATAGRGAAPRVTIEVYRNAAWLGPAGVPEVEDLLSVPTLRPHEDKGAAEFEVVHERIHARSGDRLGFSPNFLPDVGECLAAAGYDVGVVDRRVPSEVPPADEAALAAAGDDAAFLRLLAAQPAGLVEVRPGRDVLDRLALAAGLFPSARVVVMAPSRADARAVRRGLYDRLGPAPESRRGVYTAGHAPLPASANDPPRVLLLPYAHRTWGVEARARATRIDPGRAYGFVPEGLPPDGLRDAMMRHLCGPLISRRRPARRDARVVMLAPPVPAYRGPVGCGPDRKRVLYWRNDARNRHVARVALACASRRASALKDLGLSADSAAIAARGAARGVAVVCESLEHARALSALLPGWPVRAGAGKGDAAGGPHAIRTSTSAADDPVRAGVVVLACGGERPPYLKDYPPRADVAGPDEALILDADDGFHVLARGEADGRIREYARRGMRVERVGARRPGRRRGTVTGGDGDVQSPQPPGGKG